MTLDSGHEKVAPLHNTFCTYLIYLESSEFESTLRGLSHIFLTLEYNTSNKTCSDSFLENQGFEAIDSEHSLHQGALRKTTGKLSLTNQQLFSENELPKKNGIIRNGE